MKNITTIVFLLIVLATCASAYEDFSATAPKEIDVCACADTPVAIEITNLGFLTQNTNLINGYTQTVVQKIGVTSDYTVTIDGPGSDFITLSSSTISIKSEEKATLYGHVSAPCNEEGIYDLYIDIESNNIKKRISSKVIITRCSNVKVSTDDNDITIDPCGVAMYTFTVHNKGDFSEVYTFDVSKFGSGTTFTNNPVTVGAGQKAVVAMRVEPGCDMLSDKQIVLGIQAERSRFYSELPLYLRINDRYYDYRLELGQLRYEVCKESTVSIPFTIENLADNSNNVKLNLIGDKQATLAVDQVLLSADASSQEYIIVDAEVPGIYQYSLAGKSGVQDIKNSIDFTLNVLSCHGVDFEFGDSHVNYTLQNLTFNAIHIAELSNNYSLNIIGPDWLEITEQELVLSPYESKEITFISAPNSTIAQGKYPVVVNAILENGLVYTAEFDIILSENYGYKEKILYGKYSMLGALLFIDIIIILLGLIIFLLVRKKNKTKQKTLKDITKADKKKAGKKKADKEESKSQRCHQDFPWKTVLMILLLLALLSILVFGGMMLMKYIGTDELANMSIANETLINASSDDMTNLTGNQTSGEPINGTLNETATINETKVDEDTIDEISNTADSLDTNISGVNFTDSNMTGEVDNITDDEVSNFSILTSLSNGISQGWSTASNVIGNTVKAIGNSSKAGLLFLYLNKWFVVSAFILVVAVILFLYLFKNRKTIKKTKDVKKAKTSKTKKSRRWIWVLLVMFLALSALFIAYNMSGVNEVDDISEETDLDTMNNITKDYGINASVNDDEDEIVVDEPIIIDEIAEDVEEEIVIPIDDQNVSGVAQDNVTEEAEGISEEDLAALDGPYFKWDKNQNLTLNLNEIFIDPDGDILKFTSSNPKNVTVKIDLTDGTALFTPAENWTGISKIWFTADDGKGGITTSDKMYLVVTEASEQTTTDIVASASTELLGSFGELVRDYAYYIIMGFIILIILILITRYNNHLIKFFDDDNDYLSMAEEKPKKATKKKRTGSKKQSKKSK